MNETEQFDLVRLTDEDRMVLKVAAHKLAPSVLHAPPEYDRRYDDDGFLSGRLLGLAGRVAADDSEVGIDG